MKTAPSGFVDSPTSPSFYPFSYSSSHRNPPRVSATRIVKHLCSVGSKPFHADWIKDLPKSERDTAKALNTLVQAPQSSTHNPPSNPPATAEAILASALLLKHGLHGIFLTTTPKTEASTTVKRNAVVPNTAELDVFFPQEIRAGNQARKKRMMDEGISPLQIRTHLLDLMDFYKAWPIFWEQLHALYTRAKNTPRVNHLTSPEEQNTRLLLSCIEFVIAVLDAHAQRHDLNQIYQYFSLALQDLWDIATQLNTPRSKAEICRYRSTLRQEKWHQLRKKIKKTGGKEDQQVINKYLQFRHPQWAQQGIKSSHCIVIHSQQEARCFSIAEVLNEQHLEMTANPKIAPHFLFDNSGIADSEVALLMSSSTAQQFRDFKESPEHLQKGYYTLKARDFLEDHLKQFGKTPLHFQRQQALQEIIDKHLATSPSTQMGARAKKELILALTKLALFAAPLDMLEEITLAYAESLLSRSDTSSALLGTDYIYHYTDADNQKRYDTATLSEILSKDCGATHIPIAQRDKVNILWPQPEDDTWRTTLGRHTTSVNAFWQRLHHARLLAEIRNALSEGMPDFGTRLKNSLTELCERATLNGCSLTDEFVFTYQVQAARMNYQHAGQLLHPTQKISFTAGDILLGKQRRWRSQHPVYNRETLSKGAHHLAADKVISYVHDVQDFDTQGIFTQMLNKLKQNVHLRMLYQDYVNLLVAQISGKGHQTYRFGATPLLLIFPLRHPNERDRDWARLQVRSDYGQRTRLFSDLLLLQICSIEINVLSLMNGKIYHFVSFSELMQELESGASLAQEFKMHFPIDHDNDFSTPHFMAQSMHADLYEQIIDWQIENIDKMVRSHTEAGLFTLAKMVSDSAFILALPSLLLGPASGFSLGALLSVGPHLVQAAVSDTRQEQKAHLTDAVLALALEIGGSVAEKIIAKTVKASVTAMFRKRHHAIHLPQHSFDPQHNPSTHLGKAISIVCPARIKRADKSMMCTFARTALINRAGGARQFDDSLSWLRGASSVIFNLPSVRNLFSKRISKMIVNEIKPIGLDKLKLAREVLGNADYTEQIELAALAYFGQRFETEKMIRKIAKIERGFQKLQRQNIAVLPNANGKSSIVTEVDLHTYRNAGTTSKFLRIYKNNYQAYYKHMGKSKAAMADLLIHEFSHACLNTMDFIYVGSLQYKNGAVNVFELINLGNKNLHVSFRNYVSELKGPDLLDLAGSSSDFAGTAGINNADSITQFVSFLAKAKTSPSEFTKEFNILQQASQISDQFANRIDSEIMLSRAKRNSRSIKQRMSTQQHDVHHWQNSPDIFSNYVLTVKENVFSLYIGVDPNAEFIAASSN